MEELKVVLEMVQGLGGEAKSAFVWWLVITRLPGFILGLVGWSVAIIALQRIGMILWGLTTMKVFQQRLGYSGDMTRRECDHIVRVFEVGAKLVERQEILKEMFVD